MTNAEVKKLVGPSPFFQSMIFFILAALAFSPFWLGQIYVGWFLIGLVTGVIGIAFLIGGICFLFHAIFSTKKYLRLKEKIKNEINVDFYCNAKSREVIIIDKAKNKIHIGYQERNLSDLKTIEFEGRFLKLIFPSSPDPIVTVGSSESKVRADYERLTHYLGCN